MFAEWLAVIPEPLLKWSEKMKGEKAIEASRLFQD